MNKIKEEDLIHGFAIDQFPYPWVKLLLEFSKTRPEIKELIKQKYIDKTKNIMDDDE